MSICIPLGNLAGLHIHTSPAFRIGAASPEHLACVGAFAGGAFDHAAVAQGAMRLRGGFRYWRRGSGCRVGGWLRCRWFRSLFVHQALEACTVDQLDIAALGEGFGFFGELAGGNHITAHCAFCGHGAEEFAHHWYAHF